MARPLRLDIPGGVYHVVARGNERKAVFRDRTDREEYLERLGRCRTRFRFFVYAYCLMDNHVHLAIERGPVALSRIMLALHSAFSQRFNRRHGRVGHLFQGRYAAFLVEKEKYLLDLVHYVHANPVKAGLVSQAEDYAWSSARHYSRESAPRWLDRERLWALFGRSPILSQRGSISGDLLFEPADPPESAGRRIVRGDREYVERVLVRCGHRLPRRLSVADVVETVAAVERLTVDDLRRPGQRPLPSRARTIAAYLGSREVGIPIAQTASFLQRHESTLSSRVVRLEALIERDRPLRRRVAAIARLLREVERRESSAPAARFPRGKTDREVRKCGVDPGSRSAKVRG